MIETVHDTPEGFMIEEGFNIWEGDNMFTAFRLIYRSLTTKFYFRIRTNENAATPKYIFNWEN